MYLYNHVSYVADSDEYSREGEEYNDAADKSQKNKTRGTEKKSIMLGVLQTTRLPIIPTSLPASTSVQIHPYSGDCQPTPSPTAESSVVTKQDLSPSSQRHTISPSSSLLSSSPKDNV